MLTTMTVAAFKQANGINTLSVLRNPKTDKYFAVADDGTCYKVHQGTDWAKQKPTNTLVLVEDGNVSDACLIPVGLGAKVIASF